MTCLARGLLCLGLLAVLQAAAEDMADPNQVAAEALVARLPPSARTTATIYLHQADSRWTASLDGDVTDPATERIAVGLADGSLQVKTQPLPKGSKLCLTKMKDRAQFGYVECNSAFYVSNKGSTAAATILRGVLTLGILTVTDAASGNTGFTVSLDQDALKTAAKEAKAIEFARAAVPLLDYREAFVLANSSRQLRSFVATYEGIFDPESLVAKAKEKLSLTIEQEEARVRQNAEAEARRAEAARQREKQQLAEAEAVRQFQARLQPGDRIKAMLNSYTAIFGMVVEIKRPLAYVQWENASPATQWIRIDALFPPR